MTRIAYFDCYSGASGDMLLAALLDKSVDFEWFQEEIRLLNLPKSTFNIEKTYVQRSNIRTCRLNLTLNKGYHLHNDYSSIVKLINDSKISQKARELALKIFHKLGTAESTIHNLPLEKIHFHEVGSLDSIIDITGFSIAFSSLNIEKTLVSPIPAGSGQVICQHGILPVPAPATLEIIKNSKITLTNKPEINEECLTPTAAAILATIADETSLFPEIESITTINYGAGSKVFNEPVTSNLRLIIGKSPIKQIIPRQLK